MNDTKRLGTEPISKLLLQFSIPAVVGTLVNAIYNIVDRMFIGQYVGEAALAGLMVAFPIMLTIFAVGTLFAQGGTNILSNKLGEKDYRGADRIFANTISSTLIAGIIVIALFALNIESILAAFAPDAEVLNYSLGYMNIILVGIIFQLMGFSLSFVVRAEGFPKLSMMSMLVAAITNIILDFIFIGQLGWGIQGAAIATVTAQFIGFVILLAHFLRGKSKLKLYKEDLIPDFSIIKDIVSVGSASCMITLGASLGMMFMNGALATHGGAEALTAMGVINSVFTLFIMPINGVQGAMQPIIGYNYGANQYSRARETFLKGTFVGTMFATAVFLLVQLFPEQVIRPFIGSDSTAMATTVHGIKIYMAMLPIVCINIFGVGYFQAIKEGRKAFILGILRQIVLLIPIVNILPRIFGLTGVWASVPLADGLAVAISLMFIVPALRSIKEDKEVLETVETTI